MFLYEQLSLEITTILSYLVLQILIQSSATRTRSRQQKNKSTGDNLYFIKRFNIEFIGETS